MVSGAADRFTCELGISDADVCDFRLTNMVAGFEHRPTPTFLEAMDPIAEFLDRDGRPRHEHVRQIAEAVWQEANELKSRPELAHDDMSVEGIAAIRLLTREEDLRMYGVLDQFFTEEYCRSKLRPYAKYMWLLMQHLKALPPYIGNHGNVQVFRGEKKDLRHLYPQGRQFCWWGFTSTTRCLDALQVPEFCGTGGPRTIFVISLTQSQARDIQPYAINAHEEEVLLPPACCFVVQSVCSQANGLSIIHVLELPSENWLLDISHKTSTQKVWDDLKGTGSGITLRDWVNCLMDVGGTIDSRIHMSKKKMVARRR